METTCFNSPDKFFQGTIQKFACAKESGRLRLKVFFPIVQNKSIPTLASRKSILTS
jgi:hypothetical protein